MLGEQRCCRAREIIGRERWEGLGRMSIQHQVRLRAAVQMGTVLLSDW